MKAENLNNEDSLIISEIFRKLVLKYSIHDGTFRFVEVDIKEKSRKRPNRFYRHMYMIFGHEVLKKKNSETLATVGSFIGLDHASVNHAMNLFKEEYSSPNFSYHKWFMKTYDFLENETMRLYTRGKVEQELASLDMRAITKEEIDLIEELKKLNKSNEKKIKKLESTVSKYSEIQLSKDLENIRLREENEKLSNQITRLKSDNNIIRSEHSEIYKKYKAQNNIKV